MSASRAFWPGTRVRVGDPRLYINDRVTPCSFTNRPATVVCWYGKRSSYNPDWTYPSLIDVRFDHRPDDISHGHFADDIYAEIIDP